MYLFWLNNGTVSHSPCFRPGKGVNVEGAVPSEQEVNQPKPAKRARTSFTADQLQVSARGLHVTFNCSRAEQHHDEIRRLVEMGKILWSSS